MKKCRHLLQDIPMHLVSRYLLFMKLTFLLLLVPLLQLSAKGTAQERFSLNLEQVEAARVFRDIQKDSDYRFFFLKQDIKKLGKVNVHVKNATVPEILDLVLGKTLSYKIINNHLVVISPNRAKLADQVEVKGRIVDESGNPLAGVTVKVRGQQNSGVTTGADGSFSIVAADNDILEISMVGYESREVSVNGRTELEDIVLKMAATGLDEVVVVGYATQKKASLVGSVATVSSDELSVMPDANVASRLQGRVSGVTVTNNNTPGGTPLVRIRGFGSINNNDPLYVIDGVPATEGLASINPNDVESMTVLKDASSAAIYGSRASNGVILITTKRGKTGAPRINFSSRLGTQWNKNKMDVLNPQEAGELAWLQFRNDGLQVGDVNWGNPMYGYGPEPVIPDYILPIGKMEGDPEVDPALYRWPRPYYGIIRANKTGTDWYDEVTNSNPLIQEYNLGVSGGSEKTNYSFSFGYANQNGILKHTGFERYSLRSNVDAEVTSWLKVGEALGVAYTTQNGIANNNDLNPIALAARTSTMMPVTDIMGNWAGGWNPAALLYRNKDDYSKRLRILGNAYAEASVSNFTLKSLVGVDLNAIRGMDRNLIMYESTDAAASDILTQAYNGGLQYNWDNTLNYNNSFGEHNLNVLVGTSVVSNFSEVLSGSRSTFSLTDLDYMVLDAGEKDPNASGIFDEWYTFSYFGRLNYDYKGKYLLEGVVRRDGSSRFSQDNRWGTFPAVAVGWRLSREAFMENISWISDLKLRAAWGQNGNDNVGNYNIYSTYRANMFEAYYNISGANTTSSQAGFRKYRLGNPDARWESTTTTNFGLDAVLFDQRFELAFDVFNRKTTDMLYPDSKPATYGLVELPSVNIGEMQNRGFDASIGYRDNIGKDFSFNVQANISHYKNKVISLNDKPDEIRFGSTLRNSIYNASKAGYPISSYYGYVVEGIFNTWDEISRHPKYNPDPNGVDTYSKPGMFRYKDVNGDGVITADDRTFMGNPHPKFTYGLNIDLKYKNWDVAMFFQGVQGNRLLNYLLWDGFAYVNTKRHLYESWTEERYTNGDKITMPIITRDVTQLHLPNSAFLEDGSFFRMKSLTIGYNLPSGLADRLKMRGARIYAQTTNLFTITRYTGLDPEVTPVNNLTLGIDNGVYPTSQTVMVGLEINL